ncbi:MAG: type IV pilus modification PilV family protein [Planctomycetota bacterium]|jgi:prepilin-type N-terminal cleavage/methylation domain-containing protein
MKIRQTGGAVSVPRPTPRERPSDQKGLTLIEVMIAAMVLVVGILSFFAVFLNCFRMDDISKENIIAVNHARLMMESIRAMPFEDIDDMNGHTFDIASLRRINPSIEPGSVSVNSSITNLLDVTVTVNWAGRDGDRSLNLQARFTPFDMAQE